METWTSGSRFPRADKIQEISEESNVQPTTSRSNKSYLLAGFCPLRLRRKPVLLLSQPGIPTVLCERENDDLLNHRGIAASKGPCLTIIHE